MEPLLVGPRAVEAALDVVHEVARRTPVLPIVDSQAGEVLLKLENLQRLGAFKIRGAWNRMSRLSMKERKRGVATISSGNHGLAVAWSARRLGLRCVVHVPDGAAGRKVQAIRDEGAELREMARQDLVRTHMEETWRDWPETFIHPFAQPATIAGQGTIGWELAEDASDLRTVLVPVGGGGLASGIAIAMKHRMPHVRVLGVQARGAAPLREVFETHRPARVEAPNTIADGIRIGMILPRMADLLLRHLDGCLTVTDEEIRSGMARLAIDGKVIAEPAGAAAFAAWLRHGDSLESPVAAIVSGGNADASLLRDVLRGHGPEEPD